MKVEATIIERLKIESEVWCELVSGFGRLFSLVAGRPDHIDNYRSGKRGCRFHSHNRRVWEAASQRMQRSTARFCERSRTRAMKLGS